MVVLIVIIALAVVLAAVALTAFVIPGRRGGTVELPPDVDPQLREVVEDAPPTGHDAVIEAEPLPVDVPATPTVEAPEPTAGRRRRPLVLNGAIGGRFSTRAQIRAMSA